METAFIFKESDSPRMVDRQPLSFSTRGIDPVVRHMGVESIVGLAISAKPRSLKVVADFFDSSVLCFD